MKTVADQFAEILAAAGVKRAYGIVGDSLNGITDAIRRRGDLEWIHVRHEEVAAVAAGAEAHCDLPLPWWSFTKTALAAAALTLVGKTNSVWMNP